MRLPSSLRVRAKPRHLPYVYNTYNFPYWLFLAIDFSPSGWQQSWTLMLTSMHRMNRVQPRWFWRSRQGDAQKFKRNSQHLFAWQVNVQTNVCINVNCEQVQQFDFADFMVESDADCNLFEFIFECAVLDWCGQHEAKAKALLHDANSILVLQGTLKTKDGFDAMETEGGVAWKCTGNALTMQRMGSGRSLEAKVPSFSNRHPLHKLCRTTMPCGTKLQSLSKAFQTLVPKSRYNWNNYVSHMSKFSLFS